LDGLLAGVTIAAIQQFRPITWSKVSRFGNMFIDLSFAVLTGAYFLCEDQQSYYSSVFGFPLVAAGYGLMVTGAVSSGSLLYKWKSKATMQIATLSYAIYLTHKGVIHMTHRLLENTEIDSNLLLMACVVSSLLVALVVNRIVERPFMKLRNRMIKSR
jgi:peptidoglycan/LPS O-acetylase OafA/YrhL